jgi:NAD-dependent SIR2 family protein deacetylase
MPPTKKRPHPAADETCAICRRNGVSISFDLLHCCESCQDKVVEAEDSGGIWRTSYLVAPARLVQCEGVALQKLCGHLMPQPCPGLVLDGNCNHDPLDAVMLLRRAPKTLILLGAGASAGYNIPINLASSTETNPLVRYGPVRQAVLRLQHAGAEHGLYDHLLALLSALDISAGAHDIASAQESTADCAVVSTNIDDLAKRSGMKELQLHGSTGRLQCAPCGQTWPTDELWPPADCPRCGRRPICNLPTNTLDEEDVVWDTILEDREVAIAFLEGCERPAPSSPTALTVLAIGIATHVHSLSPELRLIIERRARKGLETNVIWVNKEAPGEPFVRGAARGPLELLGDATKTVSAMLDAAVAAGKGFREGHGEGDRP